MPKLIELNGWDTETVEFKNQVTERIAQYEEYLQQAKKLEPLYKENNNSIHSEYFLKKVKDRIEEVEREYMTLLSLYTLSFVPHDPTPVEGSATAEGNSSRWFISDYVKYE